MDQSSNYSAKRLFVRKLPDESRLQQAWQLSKGAVTAWLDDFAPSMGAVIAYFFPWHRCW